MTLPQRQEPSSCCTSSSLVWQRWQRLRLRCLDPLRGEDDEDDAAEKDDDEESSHCGTSLTRARFSGEASLSDPEAGGTNKRRQEGQREANSGDYRATVAQVAPLYFIYQKQKHRLPKMTDDVRQLYSIRASNAITVTNTCEKHMFLRKFSE